MRKTYPKVPAYDHESVEPTLYDADDLVLLEKADGSGARLCLYDERYADDYGERVKEFNPTDGDVFVGSKGMVRGKLSADASEFDGNFGRLIVSLRDRLDTDALRRLHESYDSPLLLFGEHMVKHTLDYGYRESPPPAFLGFDVYRLTEYEHPPPNPFDERFDGFLPLDDAFDVFDSSGLETIHVVDRPSGGLDPDAITIPQSSYASIQAEGVVIRSDSHNRRTKYVTPEFQEQMTDEWGLREGQATSGAELFAARYLTNARIRKTVQKLIHRHGADAVDEGTVAEATVADAWEEEMYDIRSMNIELVPQDVYPIARHRCSTVIETMRTNAALNETTLDRLWEDLGADDPSEPLASFEVNTDELSALSNRLKQSDTPERELVRTLVVADTIHSLSDDCVSESDQEMGRWLLEELYDDCRDVLWYEHIDLIANLSVGITPSSVNDELRQYITDEIEARDDVTIDEKPDDWAPDIEDADPSGLGSLF